MKEVNPTMLLAVDPGNVTGMAWVAADETGELVPESFGCAEVPGRRGAEHEFDRAIESGLIASVVLEKFVLHAGTDKTTRQMDALYIIGYIEGVCHKLGIEYHEQTPQQRKWATKAKLLALGWYRPTPDMHQVDAAKHLLTRAVNLKKAGNQIRRRIAE